jgi:hypothetical protein
MRQAFQRPLSGRMFQNRLAERQSSPYCGFFRPGPGFLRFGNGPSGGPTSSGGVIYGNLGNGGDAKP